MSKRSTKEETPCSYQLAAVAKVYHSYLYKWHYHQLDYFTLVVSSLFGRMILPLS